MQPPNMTVFNWVPVSLEPAQFAGDRLTIFSPYADTIEEPEDHARSDHSSIVNSTAFACFITCDSLAQHLHFSLPLHNHDDGCILPKCKRKLRNIYNNLKLGKRKEKKQEKKKRGKTS
jgi:hypothetical protein